MNGNGVSVAEKLDGQSRVGEAAKASAVKEDSQERINNLKLVNHRTVIRGREWLIPLVVVTAVIIFIFYGYDRLRQYSLSQIVINVINIFYHKYVTVIDISTCDEFSNEFCQFLCFYTLFHRVGLHLLHTIL